MSLHRLEYTYHDSIEISVEHLFRLGLGSDRLVVDLGKVLNFTLLAVLFQKSG
jgi:hypothetical protein